MQGEGWPASRPAGRRLIWSTEQTGLSWPLATCRGRCGGERQAPWEPQGEWPGFPGDGAAAAQARDLRGGVPPHQYYCTSWALGRKCIVLLRVSWRLLGRNIGVACRHRAEPDDACQRRQLAPITNSPGWHCGRRIARDRPTARVCSSWRVREGRDRGGEPGQAALLDDSIGVIFNALKPVSRELAERARGGPLKSGFDRRRPSRINVNNFEDITMAAVSDLIAGSVHTPALPSTAANHQLGNAHAMPNLGGAWGARPDGEARAPPMDRSWKA